MKKKSIRRNQVIIAALAIMIVVAGYLNFKTGGMETDESPVISNASAGEMTESGAEEVLMDLTENNIQEIAVADEEDMSDVDNTETESPENVGEAVMTSSVLAKNFSAQAKLNREQMRSKNKEAIIEVINNENVTDDLKQAAMENLMDMTNRSEMEVAVENLLTAKGFENCVIFINVDSISVILKADELKTDEIAQIQNIISREIGASVENIHIMTRE